MPSLYYDLTIGLTVITFLALLAYRLNSLDKEGFMAGIIIGFIILVGKGLSGLTLLMAFFIITNLSTRLKFDYKRRIGFSQEKGGVRGWKNIFANGGVAAAAAMAGFASEQAIYSAAFLGAIATSTADTLATEIGLLSKSRPRLITNLKKKVGAGASGGISILGEIMVILGSLFVGIIAISLLFCSLSPLVVILISLAGGVVGAHFDSLLGATIQGMNKCVICGIVTERGFHHGMTTTNIKGTKLIGNNTVNLLSTSLGALVAVALVYLIG